MAVSLPEDLVGEILERLLVKSLMRFKSVKRSWNALFKTNTFVKRQSEGQRRRATEENFMIFDYDEEHFHETSTMVKLLSSNDSTVLELPRQYPFSPSDPSFQPPWGHCNGVIILEQFVVVDAKFGKFVIVMWNPAIREVKLLPPSPLDHHPQARLCFQSFGADPNTFDDLKVVYAYTMFTDNSDNNHIVSVVMYSTRINSWTVLSDLDTSYLPTDYRSSAFTNGVDHFLFHNCTHILCFDFCSNQFRKLNKPPTFPGGKLREAGDTIAYVVDYHVSEDQSHIGYEIWILKQESSWTKICHIQPLHRFDKIFAIWKDCTEFIATSNYPQFVSYNSNTQPMRQFQLAPNSGAFRMFKYVQSMAPLSR